MDSVKYVGLDVHQVTISAAVLDSEGHLVMQCVLATRAGAILDFLQGLRGTIHLTFEEGTHSAWLYDLLLRRVARVLVCNPRRNALLKSGNKSDRIDARKLAELLRGGLPAAGVSRREQHHDGAATGEQLYRADRRHHAGERTAEGGLSRPGHRQRGQESVWRAASRGVAGAVGRSGFAAACGVALSATGCLQAAPRGAPGVDRGEPQARSGEAVAHGSVSGSHSRRGAARESADAAPLSHQAAVLDLRGLGLETRSSADYRQVDGQLLRSKKPVFIRGLNWNYNHELKNLFKSAATTASAREGPFRSFYEGLLAKGLLPAMARLTLARKIAAITFSVWKKEKPLTRSD